MKRFFIAAMALATIVGCSKDEEVSVFDSSKKSVELTILNGGGATRATTTPSGNANFDCADEGDLTVLFADKAGKVKESRLLTAAESKVAGTAGTDGLVPTTYSFHLLPETVQQVAVIALRGQSEPATIADARTLWTTEDEDAEVADIIVYGESGLFSTSTTTCEHEGAEYPFFECAVRVSPAHTRFEVLQFQCTDLGDNEYGYSQITLNEMEVVGTSYNQTLGNVLTSKSDIATAADGDVWSWNWVAKNADGTDAPVDAKELEVSMTVVGRNYTVAVPSKTLSITGYNGPDGEITEFKAENIYKLKVPFKEENIDETDAYICVDVDVTIAKWVVNTITPVFGN